MFKSIKFLGYAGKGHNQADENKAMGLVVGQTYTVERYENCEDPDEPNCSCPMVKNSKGELKFINHDEFEGNE